jgi:hypothetical protein
VLPVGNPMMQSDGGRLEALDPSAPVPLDQLRR